MSHIRIASYVRIQLCSYDVFLNLGRVLNRFSKDIGLIDAVLPYQSVEFLIVSYSPAN